MPANIDEGSVMAAVLTPQKTELGWIMELPDEIAAAMKVAPGSFIVLYPREGAIDMEILPPPSDELLTYFERAFEKYRETFDELKRLGD